MTLRVGSLFAGIGGFDLGFERAGFEVAWCAEWDRAAQAVLRTRFPGATVYGDIREIDLDALAPVDVVCGGFPCQDLSVAGKRAGLAGARSGLFHDAMRIVRRLRPSVLILENVPGLLSSNNGLDFATVLREVGEGWDCAEVGWRVLDSQYFGVAQRRRRVFVVGGARAGCAESILALAESCGGDPPSRGATREESAADARGGASVGGTWPATIASAVVQAYSPHGHYRYQASDQSATLQDRENRQGGHTHLVAIQGNLIGRDAGGPHGVGASESGTMYTLTKADIHAVAFGIDAEMNGSEEVIGTMKRGGEGGSQYSVAYRKSKRAKSNTDDETWVDDSLANTLNGFDTGDARTTHIVCEFCGHSHDEDRVCEECGNDLACDTLNVCSDCLQEQAAKQGNAIGCGNRQGCATGAVAVDLYNHTETGDVAATVTSASGGTNTSGPKVRSNMTVRRLTPTECERLQGFPDGWTQIGTDKPTADSHRYKQLGNAVTVNVAEWIARRVAAWLTK